MEPCWRICLLGELRVEGCGRRIARFRTAKTGLLLAYLAYYPDRTHPRELLIDTFWPPEEGRDGANNLSKALAWLRHHLDTPAGPVICVDRATARLHAGSVATDVAAFQEHLRAAERAHDPADRARHLNRAVDLYRGPLLAGDAAGWVLQERGWLEERYFAALRQLIGLIEARARREGAGLGEAIERARQGVCHDPLREETRRELIRLLAAEGQRSAALAQYRELVTLLREELGAEPSAATLALGKRIEAREEPAARAWRRGRRSMPRGRGAERREAGVEATSRRCLLPAALTRFFGREEELEQIGAMLVEEGHRLVSLTGAGGSGKTRLALEVARRLALGRWDCIAFVSLAEVSEPGRLPEAIRDALGLPAQSGIAPLEQVTASLAKAPALLLLDNFEHLVEGGALLARSLLEQAPRLALLVTSRQRLGLEGEREFPVGCLPTPGRPPPCPAELMTYASVQLFVDRARGARPDFAVTAANAEAVAALCDRLEGIPLALELAAARTRLLSPAELLRRLESRLKLLVAGPRDLPARQQTLRATIAWSHDLLGAAEKRLFPRLAVFAGGWSLEAVEAVCADDAGSAVLEGLESLAAQSLVQRETSGDGEARFGMLETIREFAWEQFAASDEAEAMRRRHARYFARLAEEAEPHLEGLDCRRWLDRLDREHDNLRAALEWCRESGEAEVGLRLGTSLIRFWEVRGHWAEGRERMDPLLALPAAQKRTAARARALLELFWLALRLGDLSEAGALGEEGLAIYREIGDPWGIAYGLHNLGSLAGRHGRAEEARALLEESLAIRRKIGDDFGIGASLSNLGLVARMQWDREAAAAFFEASLAVGRKIGSAQLSIGALIHLAHLAHRRDDFVTARALCEESLAVSRAAGDQLHLAGSLEMLACVADEQGDAAAARHACEESLAIRRRLGNRRDLAHALLVAGQIARHQPDAEGAEAFHREGLSIYEELEDTEGIARALWFLGHVARDRGDLAGSAALFRQSLPLFRERGDGEGIAQLLEEFASLAARQGQMTRAARLLGAGAAVARTIGVTPPVGLSGEYRHTSAAVRAALDDPTFTAAWAEGEAMPLEQACAHALEGDPACGSPLTPDRHRSNG